MVSLGLISCVGPRPLRGGKAVQARDGTGAINQLLVQGENPSQRSEQHQETVRVRTYTLPAGARVEQASVDTAVAGPPRTNVQTFVLSAPMPVTEREESRGGTELGAAQKDAARELGARLSSLRGITWVGVGLFLLGIASLVWPPLKLVIGSVTTSAAITAGGLALMILPTLIAGNELLILCGVALTAGAWFLAHRHGQLRGLLSSTTPATNPVGAPNREPEAPARPRN